MIEKLSDPSSERLLLSTIIKHGKNAFIDASGIVCAKDFSLGINRSIMAAISDLVETTDIEEFDVETIKNQCKIIKNLDLNNKKNLEYLELLEVGAGSLDSVSHLALQVKKFSIARELHERYSLAKDKIEQITGKETIGEIIGCAESIVSEYLSGDNISSKTEKIGDDVEAYIEDIIGGKIVAAAGIPTGFPLYDNGIGGGLRTPGVHVIAAQKKGGKSWLALNMSLNIAKLGIPVLYLDTELTKQYQTNRMLSIESDCSITLFETQRFLDDKNLVSKVRDAGKLIKELPFFYESISGVDYKQAISIIRRWLVKEVGFNEKGKANPCVVVYDYMKLTGDSGVSAYSPEWMLLGFMATDMHNLTVKYEIPILSFVQMNREGLDTSTEHSGMVAGSDRIAWLCSSLTFLRNKDENDIGVGDSYENGNKKLAIVACRYGPGLNTGDYINLYAKLSPNVPELQCTGAIREGYLHSQVSTGYNNAKKS